MNITIREYTEADTEALREIWNQVVDDGVAFPQEDRLTEKTAREFFSEQTFTGVAEDADTSATQALPLKEASGESISEKSSSGIALTRRRKRASG